MSQSLQSGFFLTRFVRGFLFYLKGFRFLFSHPKLIPLAIIPWIISSILFVICFFFLHASTEDMIKGAETFLNGLISSSAWWTYLLQPFIWLTIFFVDALWYLVLILLVSVVSFLIIGNIVAGPFLDLISEATEKLNRGETLDHLNYTFLNDLKRVLLEESKRTVFFLGFGLLFWICSLIPMVNLVTIPLGTLFGILFLGLAYLDLPMERRRLKFSEKRTYFTSNTFLMLGFGSAITLVMMVPVLNFFSPPISVIAGTLLFLELETNPKRI